MGKLRESRIKKKRENKSKGYCHRDHIYPSSDLLNEILPKALITCSINLKYRKRGFFESSSDQHYKAHGGLYDKELQNVFFATIDEIFPFGLASRF